jgi:hypothetical protein
MDKKYSKYRIKHKIYGDGREIFYAQVRFLWFFWRSLDRYGDRWIRLTYKFSDRKEAGEAIQNHIKGKEQKTLKKTEIYEINKLDLMP